MRLLTKLLGTHSEREIKRMRPLVNKVLELEDQYTNMSESDLKDQTRILRERLAQGETLDDILPEAFATVREASWRVLGMKHYPVQVIGGIVLHQGRIAEMKTGEGKTLVATLPVYLNALTGEGVHVVTVNDYLAKRDSEWMGKLYRYLGLSVGLIVHGLKKAQRREAYNSDVTYGTNNEYGFDYLRDNMVTYKKDMVQRELKFAIVDEVDSILIDEARTPLIISGAGDESTDMYARADDFVRSLKSFVVVETDTKEDQDDIAGDADYIVDEKAKSAVLTQHGVLKAERFFRIDNLSDEANFSIQHYINNALKAHGTMHLDQQYVVKDDEVVIVDDFTGRLMFGRRYSDGLHQAIEAKEGVKVERESKTLATITFQNFFRMYSKLSGMTGTALTEEDEFRGIYSLDVISIPTNKPIARTDLPDAVYKTAAGKYRAVIAEVKQAHEAGQPVLIGTVSVERSEELSKAFRKAGIPHSVLNAKQHEREAEIVAQAGRLGAVTIATNMAGRGTDILLGGNPEFMAKQALRKEGHDDEQVELSNAFNETDDPVILEVREKYQQYYQNFRKTTQTDHETVVDAGGLYIIGTERHESRRIDNQLRGRAGRQGDPGKSKFYLSLEDDLMRLFGGERMSNMFNSMGVDEDTEVQHRLLSNAIESAQKKVEGRNFGIRKNVLEYDDVMNKQREVIYGQRRKVLEGENLKPFFTRMIEQEIEEIVRAFTHGVSDSSEWDIRGLMAKLLDVFGPLSILPTIPVKAKNGTTAEEIIVDLQDAAEERYKEREEELGSEEFMREAERVVLLRTVDQKWMDHIDQMDDLRNSIGMRGYAQHDPVLEYKKEGFDMFEQMNNAIREDSVRLMMRAQFKTNQPMERHEQAKETGEGLAQTPDAMQERGAGAAPQQVPAGVRAASAGGGRLVAAQQQMMRRRAMEHHAQQQKAKQQNVQETAAEPVSRDKNKVGRNDPCPCGSGKKFKNCHGA